MKKEIRITVWILTIAIILCVAVSGWIIFNAESELAPALSPEAPPETSKPEFDISKYEIKGNVPDVVKPQDEDKTTSVTVTEDEEGNQIVANDWEKPEAPEKPSIEDDGQLTNPSKEPEYTPPTEPKDTTPKGGEKNSSGQVYLPGFGWVTPSGSEGHTIVDAGGDPDKQVGIM